MDDLTRILLGLGVAFSILFLGAKGIEHWSKGDRTADDIFHESRPFFKDHNRGWVFVIVFYGSLVAAYFFKNMIFIWISGGIIAFFVVIGRVVSIMRLLGIGPYKGHAELEQMEKELKDLPSRLKND